jgi:hypothetical protein
LLVLDKAPQALCHYGALIKTSKAQDQNPLQNRCCSKCRCFNVITLQMNLHDDSYHYGEATTDGIHYYTFKGASPSMAYNDEKVGL